VLLLFVWGALLPTYACSPEADKAIAELQKSARANISAEDWLAQIINKTSTFYDMSVDGSLRLTMGSKIVQEKLWKALFPDKRSLVFLKKYLAEIKIQQNDAGNERISPRKFLSNKYKYTYYYIYPASNPQSVVPEIGCQFEIGLHYGLPVPKDFSGEGVQGFYYYFVFINGKMKLVGINMAG
jgi:hypothetical protein